MSDTPTRTAFQEARAADLAALLRLKTPEYELALTMLLEEAPRLIQSAGWLRHGRRSGFCPVVALHHLTQELRTLTPEGEVDLGNVHTACSLAYRLAIGWQAIAPWNDMPGRRLEEVLTAFEEAATYLVEVAP